MMIGLEYICSVFGITFSELAREIKTTPQNINTWLRYGNSKSGRRISDERLKQLSQHFNLPEHLFQKKLTLTEQLKISLQFHADIPYDESPDDVHSLATLNEAFSTAMHNILEHTPSIPKEYDKDTHETIHTTIDSYINTKHKLDKILVDHSLDLEQKAEIFESINIVMAKVVESIETDNLSKTLEDIDQLITRWFSQ